MPILIYNFSIRGELIITTYKERQQECTNSWECGTNQKEDEMEKPRRGLFSLNEDIIGVLV